MQVVNSRVALARGARGMTQKALADLVGVTQGAVSKIENEQQQVTDDLLPRFAEALGYPVSFFSQSERQLTLPASFYRRRMSLSARHVNMIEAQVSIVLDNLKVITAPFDTDSSALPELDLSHFEDSPENAALEIRMYWGVPKGPVSHLTSLLEKYGIVIIPFEFQTRHIDALSIRPDDALPTVVFVSRTIPGDRLRFTLAHELGHLVLHSKPTSYERDIEDEADRFASEFLAPAADIRGQLRRVDLPRLARLKLHWKMSMAALIMRAKKLDCISATQAQYLWKRMSKLGYRTVEPNPIPREEPKMLYKWVQAHIEDLGYTEADLSEILNLDPNEFRKLYWPQASHLRVV